MSDHSPFPPTKSTRASADVIERAIERSSSSTFKFKLDIQILDTEAASAFEHDLIELIAWTLEHTTDRGLPQQCVEYRFSTEHTVRASTDNYPF